MSNSNFNMKDNVLDDVIVIIKITITSDENVLSLIHYIDKILDKFNKFDLNL